MVEWFFYYFLTRWFLYIICMMLRIDLSKSIKALEGDFQTHKDVFKLSK